MMDCSGILHLWRRWIRFAVVIIYVILLVIAVPLCIWELERKGAPDHVQAWFVGGLFVLMALPISFWGILQHIISYTTPHLQRHIIRILWMVPVYALNAWFALRFPEAAIYLDTLRECYEAYVVYNFMAYLLSFLYHEYPELDIQIEGKPPVKHIIPFCLLPPCHFSLKFIQRCKHGVLQYTVVRPAMTVIALITEMCGKYSEGDFNFTSAWSYIVIINNVSQILAMYCLVLFYKAFKEELRPLRPVPKFLCVKAVVFLSFWQALLIAALAKMGAIPENGSWVFYKDIKQVATGLQDFIICIEMFLAAIAHYYSFSHKPFVNLAAEQQNCCSSFLSMWNVKDVTDDVVEHARYIGQGMKKTLSLGKKVADEDKSEKTPLLTDRSSQATDESVVVQLAVLNSRTKQPPSPAVIVDDGTDSCDDENIFGHGYVAPVHKSTTASMNNYADFRSETTPQSERVQSHSSKHSEITVVAEINTNSNSNPALADEDFEHLDTHKDNLSPDPVSSHSGSTILTKDSQFDYLASLSNDNSKWTQNLHGEDNAPREHTENEQNDSNISEGLATLVNGHKPTSEVPTSGHITTSEVPTSELISSFEVPKEDVGDTSHNSDHRLHAV